MEKIKTAAILPNILKDASLAYTDDVIDALAKCNITPLLPEEFGKRSGARAIQSSRIFADADCLIILGGDGTILRYSSQAAENSKPILGINIGTIGFICEIAPCHINELSKLAEGSYGIEHRFMLNVDVIRNGACVGSYLALNDAVIENSGAARLIEISLDKDGNHVTDYRADGLIFSTPTGSTAYSLAAGGPIIAPDIAITCVTAICPHTLTAKPMLFDMNSVLCAKVGHNSSSPYLNVDGRDGVNLCEGDVVRITKSIHTTKLIKLLSTGFYDNIYQKLSVKI